MSADASTEATFELYDLKVEVVAPPGAKIWCGAQPGDHFTLRGEMLCLPPGQGFSIYSLAAVLPLRITRTGKRRFSHAETTAVPVPADLAGATP